MKIVFNKVVIASDHAGVPLKKVLLEVLKNIGVLFVDLGSFSEKSTDYPDHAKQVVKALISGEAEAGVLICGTGIGMSMVANRCKGIRAAVCNEGTTSARLARAHNNANVLCLGERLIGIEAARDTLITFITTSFEDDERHRRRLQKMDEFISC